MLDIYLTDLHQTMRLDLGHGTQDLAYVMRLKKIFLSVMDLLEPVLPENDNLSQLTWQATSTDAKQFAKLAQDWQHMEVRLQGYAVFAGLEAVNIIVQAARQARDIHSAMPLEQDVLMLYRMHQQLDGLLSREASFAPSFLQHWPEMSQAVLQLAG